MRHPFSYALSALLFFVLALPFIPKPIDDHIIYLPLIESNGEATAEPTATVTPTPTATPIAGGNLQCRQEGNVEICAWISEAEPSQQSILTVYGRYLVDGSGIGSKHMLSAWHFKTGISGCDSGFTGSSGVAHCSRGIGSAEVGYQVNIDVTIEGHTITTSFTPR